MSSTTAWLIGLGLAFVFAAVLAAAEAALLRVPPIRVASLAEAGSRKARILADLLDDLPRVLNAVLLSALLAQIAAATFTGIAASQTFGSMGVTIASVVLTLVLFVYAEAIPKTLAVRRPEQVALALAAPLSVLERILRPLVSVLLWFADLQMPGRGVAMPPTITEEELRTLAGTAAREGTITVIDQEMIERAFRFGDRRCDDIMVPRSEIAGVRFDATVNLALETALEAGHRWIVVFEGDLDNIVGKVSARELIAAVRADGDQTVGEVSDVPLVVPETKRVAQLLTEMQSSGNHLAIIVDEYGGAAGLVTIEDIAEELLGAIWQDEDEPLEIGPGEWIVGGLLPIEDLARLTGRDLPVGSWNTTAGLFIATLGRLPAVGDRLTIADLDIKVLSMHQRRVARLRVEVRHSRGNHDSEPA